jgi:ribosomal-protein-alanine N-acetyltransferase
MDFPNSGLTTNRLNLRKANPTDAPALLTYHLKNRTNFRPWEPLRDEMFYTQQAMRQRLVDMESKMNSGNALHLILRLSDTDLVIGECNFTQITHGPFQACYLGFSIDQQSEGQGLMHEALSCAIEFVFNHLQLHRVMANYRPTNVRSGKLLSKLGFQYEGIARAYLKVNGEWADHILTSLINENFT